MGTSLGSGPAVWRLLVVVRLISLALIQVQVQVQGGWTTVVQFDFCLALAAIFRALAHTVLLLAFSAMIPAHRNRVSDPVVHRTLMSVAPRSPSHGQMRRLQYTRQPNATAARVLKIKDMCIGWLGSADSACDGY